MPQKVWVVGEEVLAADFNTYVQQQVYATFPNTATRDAWASPPNGAICITLDTYTVWNRVAGAWKAVGYDAYRGGSGNVAITSGATDLPGLTATVTTLAGHRYWIYGKANYQTTTGTPSVETRIYEDGSTTIVDSGTVAINAQNVSFQGYVSCYRAPSAGSHTWKMTGNTAGTGVQFIQNLTTATYLVIQDVGV